MPPRDAKAELLARLMEEVAARGLADRSLRELAGAVGSSHRMLLYHFGSRDGLVAEIVAAQEGAQRDALRTLGTEESTPADVVRRLWDQVSSPELRPFVLLFFETVAYAARGPAHADLTSAWLADSEAVAAELGMDFDPAEVRLGIAVVRGLLVDVVTTGDTVAATASLERFLTMWARARAAGHPTP